MTAFLIFVTLLCGASLCFLDQDQVYVAAPLLSCVLIMVLMTCALWKKNGGLPILDIGFICALATFTYSVVPLISFWANGLQFEIHSDNRLLAYSLSPGEMGDFHWRHVLYLATLATSYLFFRKESQIPTGGLEYPDNSIRRAIVALFLVLWLYISLLQLVTGYRFNASYASDNYLENIRLLSYMPLVVTQISVKLYGALFLAKLALFLIVVQRCRDKFWLFVLFVGIASEAAYIFQLKGARSELFFLLMGITLMYHRSIAPLSLRFLVPSAALAFALFTFMGIYRGQMDVEETMMTLSQTPGWGLGVVGGEFETLLGTAYDVYQRVVLPGTELPWYIHLNDFTGILPPQQFVPFEKLAASEWYLRLIDASGLGVGYMWGVITQSLVGLDWIELILRGLLLGFILAKIYEWYARRKEDFLANIVYVYLCIRVYYTFRETTGALLTIIVWEILPFCALLMVFKGLFSGRRRSYPQSSCKRSRAVVATSVR
jgi:hypothetical protein